MTLQFQGVGGQRGPKETLVSSVCVFVTKMSTCFTCAIKNILKSKVFTTFCLHSEAHSDFFISAGEEPQGCASQPHSSLH